jgi:multidrug transporter EmrE-like cation transporter
MSPMPVLSIILAAFANAAGSVILKYSSSYRALPTSKPAIYYLIFIGAMALFGGCFPFYAYGLSKMKLSIAQPVFSVGTYLAVAIAALLFFREQYSFLKIAGLIVVIGGVVMVANG